MRVSHAAAARRDRPAQPADVRATRSAPRGSAVFAAFAFEL
jgi:hypothetical protein